MGGLYLFMQLYKFKYRQLIVKFHKLKNDVYER